MGPTTASSKSICEYFFQKVNGILWQCKMCLKTIAKSGGWTNLLNRLRLCVGKDFEQLFAELEIEGFKRRWQVLCSNQRSRKRGFQVD
jgi:hypothetical protein